MKMLRSFVQPFREAWCISVSGKAVAGRADFLNRVGTLDVAGLLKDSAGRLPLILEICRFSAHGVNCGRRRVKGVHIVSSFFLLCLNVAYLPAAVALDQIGVNGFINEAHFRCGRRIVAVFRNEDKFDVLLDGRQMHSIRENDAPTKFKYFFVKTSVKDFSFFLKSVQKKLRAKAYFIHDGYVHLCKITSIG